MLWVLHWYHLKHLLCDRQTAFYPPIRYIPQYDTQQTNIVSYRSPQTINSLLLSNTQYLIKYLLIKCSIVIVVFWKVIEIFWACLFKIKDNLKLQKLNCRNWTQYLTRTIDGLVFLVFQQKVSKFIKHFNWFTVNQHRPCDSMMTSRMAWRRWMLQGCCKGIDLTSVCYAQWCKSAPWFHYGALKPGRIKISNCWIFERVEKKDWSTQRKTLKARRKTKTNSTHERQQAGIKFRPQWWEVSALTAAISLLLLYNSLKYTNFWSHLQHVKQKRNSFLIGS